MVADVSGIKDIKKTTDRGNQLFGEREFIT